MIKKIFTVLFLSAPLAVQALPVSTFDVSLSVDFSISQSNGLTVEASSFIFDEFTDIAGTGFSSIDSTGDVGPVDATGGFNWISNSMGDVSAENGFADAYQFLDGEVFIENTSGQAITFDVFFDVSLDVSIFTDNTLYDFAYTFVDVIIADDVSTDFFDVLVEADSDFKGAGNHNDSFRGIYNQAVTLNDGESVIYTLEMDTEGFAETLNHPTINPVPVPGTVFLFLAGLALLRHRILKA